MTSSNKVNKRTASMKDNSKQQLINMNSGRAIDQKQIYVGKPHIQNGNNLNQRQQRNTLFIGGNGLNNGPGS